MTRWLHLTWVGGCAAGLVSACEARSIVLGGDRLPGQAGEGFATGGSLSTGGASGLGGSATFGRGGATGGSIPVGGVGGEAGGGFDPYPPVSWENGQGYRRSCPQWDGGWGFTCWNVFTDSRTCRPDGDPACNACSCAVPCGVGVDCPLGVTGHPADCVDSDTTVRSCFLVCDDGTCPEEMTCARYPGVERNVCVWVTTDAGMGTPR